MNERLHGLINKYLTNPLIAQLQDSLSPNNHVEYTRTDPMSVSHVRYIYSVRSRLWKKHGSRVEGIDGLLKSLEETQSEIVIHVFLFREKNFIVFSDADENGLVGVLLAPRKKP